MKPSILAVAFALLGCSPDVERQPFDPGPVASCAGQVDWTECSADLKSGVCWKGECYCFADAQCVRPAACANVECIAGKCLYEPEECER